MSEELERLLKEALTRRKAVLVNPTDSEIRTTAENLREQGSLICTVCRQPIMTPDYRAERISLGEQVEAVVHLHPDCAENWTPKDPEPTL